jgi:hypothetical protein
MLLTTIELSFSKIYKVGIYVSFYKLEFKV